MFFTSVSDTASRMLSDDMDAYVSSLPLDEFIAHQLALLVDSSQESVRRLASSIFAPVTFDFLNRISILMLLVQRVLLPFGTSEADPSFLRQIPVRFNYRHENENLLLFLVVILFPRRSEDSQQPTISVQRQSRHSSSINIDSILVVTNLVLSLLCLGSLRPMAIWCIGSRFFSRQPWLRASFLAPLLGWLNYWVLVFLARILR